MTRHGDASREGTGTRVDPSRSYPHSPEALTPPALLSAEQETERLREAVAIAIYDAMRDNDPEGKYRPWVPGGNSIRQDEARERAAAALKTIDVARRAQPSGSVAP